MLASPRSVTLEPFGVILLRLEQDVFTRVGRGAFDLINEVWIELFFANERKEMCRLLVVGFLHPWACAYHGLSERHDMMPVVHILSTETPCNDRVRVYPGPFFGHVLEECEPALFSRNELDVFVFRFPLLPVHESASGLRWGTSEFHKRRTIIDPQHAHATKDFESGEPSV